MGLSVASGSKLAAGSGRTSHIYFPNIDNNRQALGAVGTNATYRNGILYSGGHTTTVGGASGAARWHNAQLQGAWPGRIENVVAGDLAEWGIVTNYFPLLEQLGNNDIGNPSKVIRFIAVLAYPLLGGALGAAADLGMEIRVGNIASLNNGATRPGIMFGPVDAGLIGLRIRKAFGGAYTLDRQLTFAQAGVVDITKFNVWELRIVSADAAQPAKLKALINGVQFGNPVDMSAAAGILFDHAVAGGGFAGWKLRLMNTNTGNYTFYCNEYHAITAADESDAA